MTSRARDLWRVAEPYHAITYFAPEAHAAFERAGLRGFWRGYFAGRAAPLGPVAAGVVTATFFGFHPAFVSRAVPSVWSLATPDAAIDARLAGVGDALRRMFDAEPPPTGLGEAAARLRGALEGCDAAGRPLFAANLELDWPTEPHVAMWHAVTLLREHRGDGHVAALAAAGIGPCEAHVTQIAANGTSPDTIRPYRGWTDDDWAAATERLRARGWLDDDGRLTANGRAGRDGVEHDTDRLAAEPVEQLGGDGCEIVVAALAPVALRLAETGLMPYPNPIGVPAPEPR